MTVWRGAKCLPCGFDGELMQWKNNQCPKCGSTNYAPEDDVAYEKRVEEMRAKYVVPRTTSPLPSDSGETKR